MMTYLYTFTVVAMILGIPTALITLISNAYIYWRIRRFQKLSPAEQAIWAWKKFTPWLLPSLSDFKVDHDLVNLTPDQLEFLKKPDAAFITYLQETVEWSQLFPQAERGLENPVACVRTLFDDKSARIYRDVFTGIDYHLYFIFEAYLRSPWRLFLLSPQFNKHLDNYLYERWLKTARIPKKNR